MRRAWWAMVAATGCGAVGCGRIGFGAVDGAAAGDGAGNSDAVIDGAGTPDGIPLTAPRPIVELSDPQSDDDPSVTADLLELVYESNRSSNIDLWVSHRATPGVAWGSPVPITELNTLDSESAPEISRDGLSLVFASNRPGGDGGEDIYVATRPDRASPWMNPTRIVELSTSFEESNASISEDGLAVVFSSNRTGDPAWDLYRAVRASTAVPFGAPSAIGELNQLGSHDSDASLDASGLVLWFASNRAGTADIYTTSRPSYGGTFAAPILVTDWMTADDERDAFVELTAGYAVFARVVAGDAEIWEAQWPP